VSIIKTHDITLNGGTNDQIVLSPLSDKHLPFLYKWNADPEVVYWSDDGEDDGRSHDAETVHKIFGGVSQNAFCFLIEVDGIPVGDCWLQKMNLENVKAMYDSELDVRRIDMAVGEKEYWNKGIGSQFIPMLIDFAFRTEHVDVLHCFSEDYNARSCRMWEKTGFTLILVEKLPQPQKGKYQYHFRLTKDEYLSNDIMST
jgi:RimJ/RimL family protein N-acetyltransferase